jgi:hypothetical protein
MNQAQFNETIRKRIAEFWAARGRTIGDRLFSHLALSEAGERVLGRTRHRRRIQRIGAQLSFQAPIAPFPSARAAPTSDGRPPPTKPRASIEVLSPRAQAGAPEDFDRFRPREWQRPAERRKRPPVRLSPGYGRAPGASPAQPAMSPRRCAVCHTRQ